jgi:hypothetical protein
MPLSLALWNLRKLKVIVDCKPDDRFLARSLSCAVHAGDGVSLFAVVLWCCGL